MDVWMSLLTALAGVVVSAAAARTADLKVEEYNSSEAVDNLRRQLMKDNYDYISEASTARPSRYHAESEEGEAMVASVRASAATTLETPVDFYTKVTNGDVASSTGDTKDHRRNPMYDQRSKYVAPSERRKLATAGADKALYADDDKVRRQNDEFTLPDPESELTTAHELGEYRRRIDASDTTVKYSLLKVRKTRRSGQRTQLVKEEKPGEVSIVNLGEGAVPQFRLPRPRAQYMRDSDTESDRDIRREPRARREPLPAVDLD